MPVRFPGIHPYDDAPLPVKFVHCPLQIDVGLADAVTVGMGLTVMVIDALAVVQPVEVVTLTVYVVVVAGDTVIA